MLVDRKLWTVILAAGAGRRLVSLTGGIPKQFWLGARGTSLLEDTISRFTPFSASSRTVVVVDASHRAFVGQGRQMWGTTVYQPADRGTAAGVLISLLPVLATAPDSIVVVTPSDHGVADHVRFHSGLAKALRAVETSDAVVLCGAEPTSAREDYGWIVPALPSSDGVGPVAAFVEKPAPELARQLFGSGAVWNTMVVVGRARVLRDLCFEHVPDLEPVFDAATRLGPSDRARYLTTAYPGLTPSDFSRDVLTPAIGLMTYVWPAAMGWTDLGTPGRFAEWHQRCQDARTASWTAA